ncbi:MAG: helix-hairpin-helix domain-containing protein [Candidatus Woesebacteria bacterium]
MAIYKSTVITDELTSLPGIGVSIAKDLRDLGIQKTFDLKDKDPEKLYEKLEQLRGAHIDRCVLYVFRCIVYAVTTKSPDPKLLLWWNWKDQQ